MSNDYRMIERVARVLAAANYTSDWYYYTGQAKAAIAAMREPTEKMCVKSGIPVVNARSIWYDMIDAALKE